MDEIFVLNKNLELVYIIDAWKSLIWAKRYDKIGDCEIYLPASSDVLENVQKGFYIVRKDDDMICRVTTIELDTDAENGNYVIITGYDAKYLLDMRIIWGTSICNGKVEDFIFDLINKSTWETTNERKLKKPDGSRLLELGAKAGFGESLQQQVSYANVGQQVREYCQSYGWGYRVQLSGGALVLSLYAGADRSQNVIFCDEFENLISTKYKSDDLDAVSAALVAGEGEGNARTKTITGGGEGVDRQEIFVDAKDLTKQISFEELKRTYPTGTAVEVSGQYFWRVPELVLSVIDADHEAYIKLFDPSAVIVIVSGVKTAKLKSCIIATLPESTPNDADSVSVHDIVYLSTLKARGYTKLSEHGSKITFEGYIEPNTTFEYKKDYFLGDIVKVLNEYGIGADARITEIVETFDDNGYKMQPKFEYVEVQ